MIRSNVHVVTQPPERQATVPSRHHCCYCPATMHSKGIDWKSLMKQQPQPTTVIKKKPANPSPATPLAPSGSTASGDVSAISQPALPILFLKRMMPEEAIIE